jgi:hypothetical protein
MVSDSRCEGKVMKRYYPPFPSDLFELDWFVIFSWDGELGHRTDTASQNVDCYIHISRRFSSPSKGLLDRQTQEYAQ